MASRGGFRTVLAGLLPGLPAAYRRTLEQATGSEFATADVTAALLGHDLWFPPLAAFRDRLLGTGERPHLWTFAFAPSGAWDTARWNRLGLQARIVRARAGSIARAADAPVSAWKLQLDARRFNAALTELKGAHLWDGRTRVFEPVTTSPMIETDLALIEVLTHWFQMLVHRERVLEDRHATGFEVHGYAEACSLCRERWGLRAFEGYWVPPFHPGCRCFAQPRFTAP